MTVCVNEPQMLSEAPEPTTRRRILFVDDEPLILRGLQALLRRQRGEWDMVFVEGGEAALRELERVRFDVIVSDMRMPGMDGETLLREVKRLHPNTVRIVLSGHTELAVALRTAPIAHQFLSKPCEPESLRSVLNRACTLQSLMHGSELRDIISGLGEVPSAPSVYAALNRALADPNRPLSDVARIVEQDIAMSAKLLQLVNSSFFGLPRRISSVSEAVSYLGTNMLKSLALTVEAFRVFKPTGNIPGFSLERVRQHSMVTASIARAITQGRKEAEEAFTAGLLHDLGTIVLATTLSERFAEVLERSQELGEPLQVVEEEAFGVTHAEIGAYLLGLWGLPHTIVDAVAHHHRPLLVAEQSLSAANAVYFAEALSEELEAPDGKLFEFDAAQLSRLGLLNELPKWRKIARERAEAARSVSVLL